MRNKANTLFLCFLQISKKIGLHNLPEMVFNRNYLRIKHSKGLNVYFLAMNALKFCVGKPKPEKRVKVQYAKEWSANTQLRLNKDKNSSEEKQNSTKVRNKN